MLYSVHFSACVLAALLAVVQAGVPMYAQCGGIGYTGKTECEPPGFCNYLDQSYSVCLPTTTTSSKTTGKPTSTGKSTTSTKTTDKPPPSTNPTTIIKTTSSPSTTTKPSTTTFKTTSTTGTYTLLTPTSRSSKTTSTSGTYTLLTPTSRSSKTTSTTGTYTILTLTSRSSKTTTTSTTCITIKPIPTIKWPIITSPISGIKVTQFELNELASGAANLAPKGVESEFEYLSDPVGSSISIKPYPWNPCKPIKKYLSIEEAYPASYKPLVWTEEEITKYWVIVPGKEIYTSARSPYGSTATFLACGDDWQLFLQTGDEYPKDLYCEKTSLVLVG